MEAYKYHVYVCEQRKPEGLPCCSARGSARVIEALRREIAIQNLADDVQITTCGSLGLCERGPNMVVYPDGTWYSGLKPEDVPGIVRQHFGSGKTVERLVNRDVSALRAEIDSNKAKMLGSLKARDDAGVVPDDLMTMFRGFQESRVLLTAVELDVFTAIAKGSTAEQVASRLKISGRGAEILLNALVAMEILRKENDVYHNTPISERYLVSGGRDDSRLSLMHTVRQWMRWSTLTECVRRGTSVSEGPGGDGGGDWTAAFIAAMDKNAALRAPMVVNAVGAQGIRRMLDVGGGSGAYSIAFARANKDLKAEVFDLPSVMPLTREYIKKAGLSDRVGTRPGDMRVDDFGTGYDLVFISAICHMNSPDENQPLFEKALNALITGGRIVMQDYVLEPDKTAPRMGALFAINMLVSTRAGCTYSELEYRQWLEGAGFRDVKRINLPAPTALMMGVRP